MQFKKDLRCIQIKDIESISTYEWLELSFFQNFLKKYVIQGILSGSTVLYSINSKDQVTGIFIYSQEEREGAIFAKDVESFSLLAPHGRNVSIFSELKLPIKGDRYLIMEGDISVGSDVQSCGNLIEVLQISDLPDLMECVKSVYSFAQSSSVRASLQDGDICFIARINNHIAGFAFLSIANHDGRFPLIGVLQEYHGLGIGNDLMRARMSFLKKMGVRRVFSEIEEHNVRSLELSKKFGFKPVGQLWLYGPDSGSWSATIGALGQSGVN